MFKAEYNILLCKSPRINTLIKSETGHACLGRMGKSLLSVCLPFISLREAEWFSSATGSSVGCKLLAPFPATCNRFHLKAKNSENASTAQNASKCELVLYASILLLQVEGALPEKRQPNFTRRTLPNWRCQPEIVWQVCYLSQSRRRYNTVKLWLLNTESHSSEQPCEATVAVFKNFCYTWPYQMALFTFSYRCLYSYCMTKMGGDTYRKELFFIHFQELQYTALGRQSSLG